MDEDMLSEDEMNAAEPLAWKIYSVQCPSSSFKTVNLGRGKLFVVSNTGTCPAVLIFFGSDGKSAATVIVEPGEENVNLSSEAEEASFIKFTNKPTCEKKGVARIEFHAA